MLEWRRELLKFEYLYTYPTRGLVFDINLEPEHHQMKCSI